MIVWSAEVPQPPHITYNNEPTISRFLRAQMSFANSPFIALVFGEEPRTVEAIGLHSAALLESLLGSPLHIHWITCYETATFETVGNNLRSLFLSLWAKEDGILIDSAERQLLGIEWSHADPESFFERNLLPLFSKLVHTSCLVFVDLRIIPRGRYRHVQAIYGLLSTMIRFPSGAQIRPVILCTPSLAELVGNSRTFSQIHSFPVVAPSPDDAQIFAERVNSAWKDYLGVGDVNPLANGRGLTPRQCHLVQSLLTLDRPAMRQGFHVLKEYSATEQEDLADLVERYLLVPLRDGGVTLGPRLGEQDRSVFASNLGASYLHPQVASVIDLVPPSRLNPLHISLGDLECLLDEQRRVLELLAHGLSRRHGDADLAFDAALEALDDPRALNWLLGSESIRNLLRYLSQVLLTKQTTEPLKLFSLLERITFSFSSQLFHTHRSGGANAYESSRWVTNLPYVYSHGGLARTMGTSTPKAIFLSAANFLNNVIPVDSIERARVKYWKAWQIHDAGQPTVAGEIFGTAGEELFLDRELSDMDAIRRRNYVVELVTFSILLGYGKQSKEVLDYFFSYLWSYAPPGFWEKLRTFRGEQLVMLRYAGRASSKQEVTVLASIFDLHVALLIAGSLYSMLGSTITVLLAPRGKIKDEDERTIKSSLADVSRNRILIAGPDTPGCIGPLACSIEPELARLYQIKLTDCFHSVIREPTKIKGLFLLSGCGLGSNAEAWSSAAHYFFQEAGEEQKMETLIAEALVRLLKVAEGRVSTKLVDMTIAAIEKTIGRAASSRLQELKHYLQAKIKHPDVPMPNLELPPAAEIATREVSGEIGAARIFIGTAGSIRPDIDLEEFQNLMRVAVEASAGIHS
ncbi:MAG: hypothetical protein QOF14_4287, partial [Hyphomicrobiales bacterium]|nr:hypothetical protein [Hyphomicrobiales bacterium]